MNINQLKLIALACLVYFGSSLSMRESMWEENKTYELKSAARLQKQKELALEEKNKEYTQKTIALLEAKLSKTPNNMLKTELQAHRKSLERTDQKIRSILQEIFRLP